MVHTVTSGYMEFMIRLYWAGAKDFKDLSSALSVFSFILQNIRDVLSKFTLGH